VANEVIGLHFVCLDYKGVEQLSNGVFLTRAWKVEEKHLATVRHIALHQHRKEPSYLQGELLDFEQANEAPDRFIFRVRATPDPYEWPSRSGSGEKAYCRASATSHCSQVRAPSSLMYECEVKLLHKIEGQKLWLWKVRRVSSLPSGSSREIRCMHCHGAVRVHKQRVEHGPADHVEHLHRSDAVNCRGGYEFCGTHSMSDDPID
jgi:hypothetical protein